MKLLSNTTDLQHRYDVVVIGAGPAGMAAVDRLSDFGATILLADENTGLGGQIYRAITSTPITKKSILGVDYWRGKKLTDRLDDKSFDYAPRTTVWHIGASSAGGLREVGVSINNQTKIVMARHIIIATGAMERPFPISGWTLPGVMTAGAVQTALKSSGAIPSEKLVIAGTGPLLYLLCTQLQAAGAKIEAILETTSKRNFIAALRHFPSFVCSPYFWKGLKLLLKAKLTLNIVTGVTNVKAEGDTFLNKVVFTNKAGKKREIETGLLLLHQGVVPHVNMANSAGCSHQWDEDQCTWVPELNERFESSQPGISIAGDGAGIAGAEAAAVRGALAAVYVANRLGALPKKALNSFTKPLLKKLQKMSRGRKFIDMLYQPLKEHRVPVDDDIIVCRCEEVNAGQIRKALVCNVSGPNQLKTFLRCGMGPCQGRLCGLTVTELMADFQNKHPDDVGYYRLRSPVKPITIGELASLPATAEGKRAVR